MDEQAKSPGPATAGDLGERYRLETLIGRGGMASVWQATDTVLDRAVAVKRLHANLIADEEHLERFRREARVVARLSHPNLVHLLDRGEDAEGPYLVMELVEGENLKARIRREGRLPPSEAARVVAQVAHALAYAHANGVVHRDIKAQNVLLTPDGHAKLADFGIARLIEVDSHSGLTRTDMLVGSADYIAPEQADGSPVSARTDVYALGVVLYECLTGRLPFSGDGFVATAMRHVNEPMPDPRVLAPEVPAHLAAAVLRACEKRPEARFATADDMALALEGPVDGGTAIMPAIGAGAGRAARARRPFRRRTLAVWGLALALLAAAAGVSLVALDPFSSAEEKAQREARASAGPLPLAAIQVYDPGDADGDPTAEYSELRGQASDGDPSTAWPTNRYQSADFSGLKDGLGLLLRLPAPARVTELVVSSPTPGATFEVRGAEGEDGERPVLATGTFTESAQTVPLEPAEPGTVYLLWITSLVADEEEGGFDAAVGEVALRGTPA